MTYIERSKEEEENTDVQDNVVPFRVIHGGRGPGIVWLLDIPNNTVFLSRPASLSEYNGFFLESFRKTKRIGESIAVELVFPTGEVKPVDAVRFSEKMEFIAGFIDDEDI